MLPSHHLTCRLLRPGNQWKVCKLKSFRQYSQEAQAKTAILLHNMGDSHHTEDVAAYLERLFTDEDIMSLPFQSFLGPLIAKRRAPRLMQKYKEMAPGKGLLEWTEMQGALLTNTLDKMSPETGPHKYFIGFRYSKPLIEDALLEIEREGIEQVVAFSQYPQYSCCTTGSNLNAMYRFCSKQQLLSKAKWIFIDRWPVHNAITQAYADIIKEELKKFPEEVRQQVVLLFSAHSLPMKVVDRGDTYPAEVAATVVSIMSKLNNSHPYRLVWQSKVGPMPWLSPKTEEAMHALVKEGHRHVMVVPVSFVNEHVETLYDMDVELGRELAPEIGVLNFIRAPALNDHHVFIQGIADLVKEHLVLKQKCSPQLLMRCPMCPNDACKNMRRWIETLP
ncbi:ferrochelatase, mitochondrial [Dermacentor silvarum]|uniref:ferrochelatase, mitochondrial n=1 Tax=Dermacentor silvarum TaxID=543639 RepID=UPI001897AF87|nr:ferrochelatase, mitochondrial [Dermacentor silvarum]